ncbi:hypothetical protein E4U41_002229 [Claviceps citrina]|nr:hypothetical protein E4U41_002229 [Claviceps citrina]
MSPDVLRLRPGPLPPSEREHSSAGAVGDGALSRVLDQRSDYPFSRFLPKVNAVTGFVVRRQCRRRLPPWSLELMLQRLPRLKSFTYETWRARSKHDQEDYDGETMLNLQNIRRLHGLTRISIFEDFNQHYMSQQLPFGYSSAMVLRGCPPVRFESLWLARTFARATVALKYLEHLSVAYMIDASTFFRYCLPTWTWESLRFLSLTSKQLRVGIEADEVSLLLTRAASAAIGMPNLDRMLIWNAQDKDGSSFEYRRAEIAIVWRAGWNLKLPRDALRAWSRVVAQHYPPGTPIPPIQLIWHVVGVMRTRAEYMRVLKLPPGIVDAVSLFQMEMEATPEEQAAFKPSWY